MHQLFLQITKEGARDAGQALENMSMDIDASKKKELIIAMA